MTRLPDGSLQTVMLQKTAVYAQTGSGWLQTDPALKTSFWGPYKVNTAGSNVTLIYPNRDKVLGRRLLADFDEMVQQLCRDPDLHCPPDFKLRVVLNTEVESYLPLLQSDLLQLSGRIFNADLNQAIYEVALPTPTLVGIPQDDAGYAALWRGYAAWTAVHLLNDMVETPLSYTAVKAKLTQLGLHLPAPASFNPQPQPLTANPPAQSVQVLCRDRGQAAEIWTYDLQTNTWAQLTDETARTHFYDQLAAKETVSIIAPLRRDAQPSEQALLTAVSPAYTPTSLSVTQVWQHESMRTFLAQDQADEKMHYLFQENLTNGRLQFLHRFSLSFSLLRLSTLGENGRFLTLVSYNNRLNQTRFIIYDLVQQADRTIVADGLPFNRFGWSANGEWLFVLKQRTLVLTAPATRDQTVIEHPQYGCQTALWLP